MNTDNEYGYTKDYMDKIREQITLNHNSENDEAIIGMKMRKVFLETKDGPEVLEFLLKALCYNKTIGSVPEIALHNTAVRILEIMGVSKEGEVGNQIKSWIN